MTNVEQFLEDIRQYLNLGQEKRIAYGKTFAEKYFEQVEPLGITQDQAKEMLERLVVFMSASDGEINKSEYDFCNNCLFTIDEEKFLKTCRHYMLPSETKILREYAKKNYDKFGHSSYYYILAIFIVAANNTISVDEQKKLCSLFGII